MRRCAWRSRRGSTGRKLTRRDILAATRRSECKSGPNMEDEAPESVLVPYTELSAELLHAVIESFVLREGTDYGEREVSLQDKVARVVGQLESGKARIMFDPQSESVTIVT
jgi:uncharacterized protein YheU (UPF0270 family)